MTDKSSIPVINRSEAVRVYTSDILYIENDGRKIHIYTENGDISTYRKIDEISGLLPPAFYRCHKSLMINLEKVTKMAGGVIYFGNTASYKLGRENFSKAIQTYKRYLIDRHGLSEKV